MRPAAAGHDPDLPKPAPMAHFEPQTPTLEPAEILKNQRAGPTTPISPPSTAASDDQPPTRGLRIPIDPAPRTTEPEPPRFPPLRLVRHLPLVPAAPPSCGRRPTTLYRIGHSTVGYSGKPTRRNAATVSAIASSPNVRVRFSSCHLESLNSGWRIMYLSATACAWSKRSSCTKQAI